MVDLGVPMKCCSGCCCEAAEVLASLMSMRGASAALALVDGDGPGVVEFAVSPSGCSLAAAACAGSRSVILAGSLARWVSYGASGLCA